MPIIEINHVTKEYQLGQLQSLKNTALNQWRRLTGQPIEERAPFKALDDVSFSIEPGEVVGIIGHNGAGKSTILKLLANIAKPSSGSIQVKGKIAPLIEVGAGLVGDLTGRENSYLNGSILDIPKAKIKRKFDDIHRAPDLNPDSRTLRETLLNRNPNLGRLNESVKATYNIKRLWTATAWLHTITLK